MQKANYNHVRNAKNFPFSCIFKIRHVSWAIPAYRTALLVSGSVLGAKWFGRLSGSASALCQTDWKEKAVNAYPREISGDPGSAAVPCFGLCPSLTDRYRP